MTPCESLVNDINCGLSGGIVQAKAGIVSKDPQRGLCEPSFHEIFCVWISDVCRSIPGLRAMPGCELDGVA